MKNELLTTDLVSARYSSLQELLRSHPLYDVIHNENNLRTFMEHHVYAVWDFMSIIKSLQNEIAPINIPWHPPANPRLANFINQLVLEEESDRSLTVAAGSTHASHFQSYCLAMAEIGADVNPVLQFVDAVGEQGFKTALRKKNIPAPAKQFMAFTFDIIERNQPHLTATALAYGRESLVPLLFRSIQKGLQLNPDEAPILYGYLKRHIQLDEEEHGPLVTLMVKELCDGSREKLDEVVAVAEQALTVRLEFWNGIYEKL